MQRSQKILIGALLCCQLYVFAPAADRTLDTEPVAPRVAERFDCENAFDLVAMMVVASCARYQPPPEASAAIDRASARLRETQLASAEELSQTSIAFCPLAAGTGMVPTPHQLYLDDGLLTMSADGLAEILAHELEHVQQFARLGTREFKCQYVRDMLACGGCQDRSHGLEAAAYARQDQARARLSAAASR
jgi:hypothetical protein